MCGPNANAPQTTVKAHTIEWHCPAGHCWHPTNSPHRPTLEPGQSYGPSLVVCWSLPPHQRSLSLHSERNVVTSRCPALSLAPFLHDLKLNRLP
uniref:Stretch regulated skeletal muscle protein n=1 Tax=Mus musculus TaxID=10090 RepID=Q9ER49_MOUSE|nr:unnamed protein product [Mus musculus]CAC03619.1 stretch regulated skeletal muscle protein [Mus musculus]